MTGRKRQKPDFICIGPTKTGTSWLWTVLRLHPEIWLPPVSEVNYYWDTGKRLPKNTAWQSFKQRIKGDIRIKWRRSYAKERWKHYRMHSANWRFRDIWWDVKYLFFPQTPSWYKSLFDKRKVAGDITGGYFTMDDIAIEQLAQHLPHAKIMINFRDPVSRLWSEARMILLHLQGKPFDQVSDDAFFQRFDRAHARLESYVALYERWRKHFAEEQILICYYDDLMSDPAGYIARICAFLGVSEYLTPAMREAMTRRVFEGPRIPLPAHYRKYLIEKTLPCVRELDAYTKDVHPRQWLLTYQMQPDATEA